MSQNKRSASTGRASTGQQFINPNISLQNDVDEVLKRAGLKRSDLLRLRYDEEIFSCTEKRIAHVLSSDWTLEGDQSDWLYQAISHIHEQAVRVMMQAK